MKKRIIAIDSTNNLFRFSLSPGEMAHIGSGPITMLWGVKSVVIVKGESIIKIYSYSYGQFDMRKSGLFKYVGIKEITD